LIGADIFPRSSAPTTFDATRPDRRASISILYTEQCAITQADQSRRVDAGEQTPRLVLGEHRRLAAFNHMLRPAHRMRRVDRKHLTDNQPIEQMADRSEVLLP